MQILAPFYVLSSQEPRITPRSGSGPAAAAPADQLRLRNDRVTVLSTRGWFLLLDRFANAMPTRISFHLDSCTSTDFESLLPPSLARLLPELELELELRLELERRCRNVCTAVPSCGGNA